MLVVQQRKPSLLWLNLWYLQWWKLLLKFSCGWDIQNLSLLDVKKIWASAIVFPCESRNWVSNPPVNDGWNEPTSSNFIRVRQRGAYIRIKMLWLYKPYFLRIPGYTVPWSLLNENTASSNSSTCQISYSCSGHATKVHGSSILKNTY